VAMAAESIRSSFLRVVVRAAKKTAGDLVDLLA